MPRIYQGGVFRVVCEDEKKKNKKKGGSRSKRRKENSQRFGVIKNVALNTGREGHGEGEGGSESGGGSLIRAGSYLCPGVRSRARETVRGPVRYNAPEAECCTRARTDTKSHIGGGNTRASLEPRLEIL